MRPPVRCLRVCLALAACIATTGAAEATTLRAAISHALKHHPEMRAALAGTGAVSQDVTAAQGLWKPKVELAARAGGQYENQIRRKAQPAFDVSVTLTQQVFDAGRNGYEVARQKQLLRSSRMRLVDTANALALQVAQAYLEVRRARFALIIARNNLSRLAAINVRVRARVRGGRGNPVETSQAAARIAAARTHVADAAQRLRDARAFYLTVTGLPAARLRPVPMSRIQLPGAVAVAVRQARRRSPRILALRSDHLAADAAIGSARAALMPRLDVEVSANYAQAIEGVSNERENVTGLLVMRWNLYNGGINRARIRQARYRSSKALSQSRATALDVERVVRTAWSAIIAARERHKALSAQLIHNQRALSIQVRQFNAGTSTLLDILDTQNELFATRIARNNASFLGKFSRLKVLAAMGRLLRTLKLGVPST